MKPIIGMSAPQIPPAKPTACPCPLCTENRAKAGNPAIKIQIEIDTKEVQAKLERVASLLQDLPEGALNRLRYLFPDLNNLSVDFALVENATTGIAGGVTWRYTATCPVLDEILAVASRASNAG